MWPMLVITKRKKLLREIATNVFYFLLVTLWTNINLLPPFFLALIFLLEKKKKLSIRQPVEREYCNKQQQQQADRRLFIYYFGPDVPVAAAQRPEGTQARGLWITLPPLFAPQSLYISCCFPPFFPFYSFFLKEEEEGNFDWYMELETWTIFNLLLLLLHGACICID